MSSRCWKSKIQYNCPALTFKNLVIFCTKFIETLYLLDRITPGIFCFILYVSQSSYVVFVYAYHRRICLFIFPSEYWNPKKKQKNKRSRTSRRLICIILLKNRLRECAYFTILRQFKILNITVVRDRRVITRCLQQLGILIPVGTIWYEDVYFQNSTKNLSRWKKRYSKSSKFARWDDFQLVLRQKRFCRL